MTVGEAADPGGLFDERTTTQWIQLLNGAPGLVLGESEADAAAQQVRVSLQVNGHAIVPGPEEDLIGAVPVLTFTAAGNDSVARIRGRWPRGSIFIPQGVTIQVEVDLDEPVFVGPGTITLDRGELTAPSFESSETGNLLVKFGSRAGVLGASGEVRLDLEGRSPLISGSTSGSALVVTELNSLDGSEGELDNVDIRQLTFLALPALQRLRRLRVRWSTAATPARSEVTKWALAMDMKVNRSLHPGEYAGRLAYFWDRVAAHAWASGSDGPTMAISRELAYESRLLNSTTTEKLWINVVKAFGYGTRILRPLGVWFVVIVASTLTLISLHPTIPPTDIPRLLLEVALLPLTLIRGLGEDTRVLSAVLKDGGTWELLVIAIARLLGAAALVFTGLGIRTYTRLGR